MPRPIIQRYFLARDDGKSHTFELKLTNRATYDDNQSIRRKCTLTLAHLLRREERRAVEGRDGLVVHHETDQAVLHESQIDLAEA